MKRYFITGTDTDCGKTYVTACLLDSFPNALAIKPVASGCEENVGKLVSSDAIILQQHRYLELEKINPWRFKSPVSPHIAAREDGVEISAKQISDYCLQSPFNTDLLFIEGAGGLEAPLSDTETWVDFLKISQIPVILVVGLKLGCLNHAILTANTLRFNQIDCVGWIGNSVDPNMLARDENISTLKNKLPFDCIGLVQHNQNTKLVLPRSY